MDGKEVFKFLDYIKELKDKEMKLEKAMEPSGDEHFFVKCKERQSVYREVINDLEAVLRELNS